MKSILVLALITLSLVSCQTTAPGTPAAGGVRPYTSDECIVTGNRLGSMGDPITHVHGNQEVKFCCSPCVRKFKANPDKYLANL